MTNMNLIDKAVKLVQDYYAYENITELTEKTREKALSWYNHTEIVDAEMLAAAVIEYGDYSLRRIVTWNELVSLQDFYFGVPVEVGNFHIGEIENSLNDDMWR